MSQRGELTVECDTCHAEQHFTVKDLLVRTFAQARYAAGWRWWNYHDVCPQCKEAKNAAIEKAHARQA